MTAADARPLLDDATFIRTTPVRAIQYLGTRQSADEIAQAFRLTLVDQLDGYPAVFRVPVGRTIMVDDYDREAREFGVARNGWVWVDAEMSLIGAEWDQYFRQNWTRAAMSLTEKIAADEIARRHLLPNDRRVTPPRLPSNPTENEVRNHE